MAQVWAATKGHERPFAGWLGVDARLDLMMAIESGWPGAQAAYDYLWPYLSKGNPADLADRAGWALDFYNRSGGTATTVAPANVHPIP
jgi:hypothetical protein